MNGRLLWAWMSSIMALLLTPTAFLLSMNFPGSVFGGFPVSAAWIIMVAGIMFLDRATFLYKEGRIDSLRLMTNHRRVFDVWTICLFLLVGMSLVLSAPTAAIVCGIGMTFAFLLALRMRSLIKSDKPHFIDQNALK